ncbi:L,D-transpeptidase family protein [Flavisphingomonas formosensis]|uniref:L,D-transpeptidase family protein n=1 Tax=Flavisphingomonas formosensis TaxID=861534 RepID=UPI0012FCB137|nr:L,D-transpeptidase [Sphingomonas formosensis]
MKPYVPRLCLGLATACLVSAAGAQPAAAPKPAAAASPAPVDARVLHLQVILDRLGFSPGVIDGKTGAMLTRAVRGLQLARGLPASGTLDEKTTAYLQQFRDTPGTIEISLTQADMAGPYQGPIPKSEAAQAKLPALGYSTLSERLSERYHTTPETLIALNGGDAKLAAGAKLKVPNVVPASRDYPADLKPDWKATLADLNVGAPQRQAAKVVVDKSEGVLRAYDGEGKLIAQFPATMGSSHDPLPIGKWKIQGESTLPEFHYNPKLFWDASKKERKQTLPPGPNGPVGVAWLDLNKPHYGIHGTPEPAKIGRTESHGCIRLTNWDVARLALMVKPGTPAIFQR